MKDFLNIIALCLLAGIGLASFAQGQTIRVVNGADPTATYRSISSAVANTPAGTIIDIVGLTDPVTGQPTIPFNGPIDLFSTDSAQFKLDGSGGPDGIIDSTPKFFHVLAPLTFKDHGGQLRPGETTGLRDKGADEVD